MFPKMRAFQAGEIENVIGINVDETGNGSRVHLFFVKALYSSLLYIYINNAFGKRCDE